MRFERNGANAAMMTTTITGCKGRTVAGNAIWQRYTRQSPIFTSRDCRFRDLGERYTHQHARPCPALIGKGRRGRVWLSLSFIQDRSALADLFRCSVGCRVSRVASLPATPDTDTRELHDYTPEG